MLSPRTDRKDLAKGRRVPPSPQSGARYGFATAASVDLTITFEDPDEEGWIVARILEVPGAMSQGRTREEARESVLDARAPGCVAVDCLPAAQRGAGGLTATQPI